MTTEEFIQKAKVVHGGKYDYSKVEYENNHTKVVILCPNHGEFLQTPSTHLRKQGCPKCTKDRIRNIAQQNALKQIDIILDRTPYELVQPFVYQTDRKTTIRIRCLLHNEVWEMSWHQFAYSKKRKHLCGCSGCRQKYSFEQCKEAAAACKTRSEFAKSFKGEYFKALREGWLEEICSHMVTLGNHYRRCIYAYIFKNKEEKYVYVGLTGNIEKRDIEHRKRTNSTLNKFVMSNKLNIPPILQLTEYMPKDQAAMLEGEFLAKYIADGYIPINKKQTGGLGGYLCNEGYTFEQCSRASAKYQNRSDWKKYDYPTYYAAYKYGWINEIMPPRENFGNQDKRYWTIERCCEKAEECSTIKEFRKKFSSAYAIVCRHKWNNIVFEKLEKLSSRVNFDLDIVRETLKKYQSTSSFIKEHRDMANWLCRHKIKLKDIATPSQLQRSYATNAKPVIQCDIEGNIIAEYNSAREAIGYDYKKISACCNGIRKTHKGYKWYFKKDLKKNKNETHT